MKPTDLGLPSRYAEWRDGQDAAFDFLTTDEGSWKVCALPTGVGKSLLAVAYAKWLRQPCVILTSTKALQTQYVRDFGPSGLVQVKGMSNYPCRLWQESRPDTTVGCDLGPCLDGDTCDYKTVGCEYYDAIARARSAPIVITNYAFWFTAAAMGTQPIGPRPFVICDEAHAAIEELSRFVGVEFSGAEIKLEDKLQWGLDGWREYAKVQLPLIADALQKCQNLREIRLLRTMHKKLYKLTQIVDDSNWCMDAFESKAIKFEPLWARQYVDNYIKQGAQEVSLLSATIRPYHMDWFGVEKHSYLELSSPFPVDRRPIWWVPTVKMSRKTEEESWPRLMKRIDDLIESRLDRKGIIHTVSFSRAKQIYESSRWRGMMLLNQTANTQLVVDRFRATKDPCVLVSPSVDTGFDFPYAAAEYQIICKVPFPVPTDPLVAARSLADPLYHRKLAVTRLVQMAGRVMRAEDDAGETFIIDDSINFLMSHTKPYFPQWFREAYKRVGFVPPAPERLHAIRES